MHFDLTDIQLFCNIAEANSLTRGAERSHLSAPAASLRIKHLERAIGCALLHRTSQGVHLTAAGHDFLRHAQQVLSGLTRLRAEMQDHAIGQRGSVRVYATASASSEYVPAVLRTWLMQQPRVNVTVEELLSPDVVRGVAEGMADIGIFSGERDVSSLRVFPYRRDRVALITGMAHPLASRSEVGIEDTIDHDFVAMPPPHSMALFLERAASSQQVALRRRIQVNSYEAVARMVEAGIGIAFMPGAAARRMAESTRIKVLDVLGEVAARDLQICVRPEKLQSPLVSSLLELLIADARDGAARKAA